MVRAVDPGCGVTESALDRIDPRELGQRLQAARKARGLTQAEVAERLDVSRTTVTAMESGDRQVRAEELTELARLYGRSIAELVQREEPVEPFTVQFRSTLPADAYAEHDLEPHVFEFQRLCEDYVELERLRDAPLATRYPPPYAIAPEPERAGEDIAGRERHRLGLGDGPLWTLREVLESDVGLRIFYLDLPSRVAAIFSYGREMGGCVAVNRNHPPERRRHSLGHEYGHFLTERYRPTVTLLGRYQRVPARERFAETFARAFLLPEAGLVRRFHDLQQTRSGRITPADLCVLAHLYFVSLQAMTLRLEELDLIPAGTWERLTQRGFEVREARALLELPEQPETPEMLPMRDRYLAAEAYLAGELSEGQLARFLRSSRVEARRTVARLGHSRDVSEDGDVSHEELDLSTPIV